MRIRHIISVIGTLCLATASFAQNLDPTVNVTRNYEGKLLEVDKPAQQVNVPDSITRFNLDFDYYVLKNKFKGSYEFVPYVLEMQPDPDAYRENRLWLRAGAGYSLHPTFDAVWSPRISNKFRMSVYGTHRSYVGKYRSLELSAPTGIAKDAWYSERDADGKRVTKKGYDLYSRLGANGRYDWMGGCFIFDAAYMDIATKESLYPDRDYARHYDAMDLNFRAHSVRDDDSYFYWDAAARIRYGVDNMNGFVPAGTTGFGGSVGEFLFQVDSRFGQILRYNHGFFLDLEANVVTYGKTLGSHAEQLALTPKYRYRADRLNVEAGVRIDMMLQPNEVNAVMPKAAMNQKRGQVAYPDVRVDWAVLEDYLDIYAVIGGGNKINPYSNMLEHNHHFSAAYYDGRALIDNSVERVSTALGLRGSFLGRLSYDLSGGWLANASAPLDAVSRDGSGNLTWIPTIAYAKYQSAFASLKMGFECQCVDVKAYADYRWTDIVNKRYDKEPDIYNGLIEPSRFKAGLSAVYNWHRRIYAGISFDSSVARRIAGTASYVPWYADLGLNFEYRFKNGLSVWAEGGNLLNQTIQRDFGYSENGANFTVGICFSL